MLLASLFGATLMRVAPGFGSDEQELNSGLSAQSIHAIRQARLAVRAGLYDRTGRA